LGGNISPTFNKGVRIEVEMGMPDLSNQVILVPDGFQDNLQRGWAELLTHRIQRDEPMVFN
jgi:hypothetical protein